MSSNNTTIGIDLGDRRHAVCVLSAAGDIVAETDLVNTLNVGQKIMKRLLALLAVVVLSVERQARYSPLAKHWS